MQKVVLIIHNVRSAHNVGSMLRTADAFSVNKVYLTGYTPYPPEASDKRLPHIASKVGRRISKTALGAESSVPLQHEEHITKVINQLKNDKYKITALEQTSKSVDLHTFKPANKIALIVGREVEGIEEEVLELVDQAVQIPMLGKKESLNVSVAAAIVLYDLTFNHKKHRQADM